MKSMHFFSSIILLMILGCFNNQKPIESGRVTYHYILNAHDQIRNHLKKTNRLADTTDYFERTPKYDTMIWVSEFDKNKSKTYILKNDAERQTDSIDRADGYYIFDPIIYKTDSLINWMETVRDTLYNIEEILGKTTSIPFEASINNERTVEKTFLGLPTKRGNLIFNMEYPHIGTSEFEIWYADGILSSAGPMEFFTKDKVILRALSVGGVEFRIEAVDFEQVTFEHNHFSLSPESIKISMDDFHQVIGFH